MTVSSLWKALDRSGCGKPVGTEEMINHNNPIEKVNPWNFNNFNHSRRSVGPSLAIDLSIWICESLTSTHMAENHTNPALYLVFTRTMKLLHLGIKPVFVIEGKRRIRCTKKGEGNKLRKRRSGTLFWKACDTCEEMLGLLGVPAVRAKAEGEALCALLNQKGIVDGVISNDGDCLLFGAKVVYTQFSIENLDRSCVIRYDASSLQALVDVSNDPEAEEEHNDEGMQTTPISLSRQDLIVFALFSGSDLAGEGLTKVGYKKATRFIRKCKLDNPLLLETAAIDELKSWARAATIQNPLSKSEKVDRCCSICNHPGSKRCHEKNGCKLCGTKPGEPCFPVTQEDRFRKSLRAKALRMRPRFDPAQVVAAYLSPNDNQIPITLAGSTSQTLTMGSPRLRDIMSWPLIIKGRSLVTSREYVAASVSRLMARTELYNSEKGGVGQGKKRKCLGRENPVPQQITKNLTRDHVDCFEIKWSVNGTVTDEDGQGIDGYEFTSIEPQELVNRCYPELVIAFREREKELKKQGDGEATRRRAFIASLVPSKEPENTEKLQDKGKARKKCCRRAKRRATFFQGSNRFESGNILQNKHVHSSEGDDVHRLLLSSAKPSDDETVSDITDFISSRNEGDHSFVPDFPNHITVERDCVGNKEGNELKTRAVGNNQILNDTPCRQTSIEIEDDTGTNNFIYSPSLTNNTTAHREHVFNEVGNELKASPCFTRGNYRTAYDLICEQGSVEIHDGSDDININDARIRLFPTIPKLKESEDQGFPAVTTQNDQLMICHMGISVRITPVTAKKHTRKILGVTI